MAGKPCYLAYIRVSTQRQGEQGVSLHAQRQAIAEYADRHGIAISEWIEETLTAAKSGRPLFTHMLALLKKGRICGVIIHKIDRGARNLKDWAALGELIDTGIDVRFVADSLDLSSRSGRLSADIQAVVAADYVRNLKEEARKGFYGRLNQGLYPLAAPLAYIDNGGGKIKTVCPMTAPLVRRAFELYSTGQFTLRQLSDECYVRGLRNRSDHRVSVNALARILRNRFYCGQMALTQTGEVFTGLHEPLVDNELFARVNHILDSRMKRKTRSHQFTYRKFVRCAACQRHLIGEIQKGHTYYRCHTRECPMKCIRGEHLDTEVYEKLRGLRLAISDHELAGALKRLRQTWVTENEHMDLGLNLHRGKVKRRLDALMDAYLDGEIDRKTHQENHERLRQRQRELNSLTAPHKVPAFSYNEVLKLALCSEKVFEVASPADRATLLSMVFSKMTVDVAYKVGLEPAALWVSRK